MSACLIHCALVAALLARIADVFPQGAPHVASLVLGLASYDVQDQGVTGHLLVLFDFDNISSLDALPVLQLEALASLAENKLLHWLTVYLFCSLLEFLVMEIVYRSPCKKTDSCDGNIISEVA